MLLEILTDSPEIFSLLVPKILDFFENVSEYSDIFKEVFGK